MSKTNEEKKLAGTLKPSRIKANPMDGSIAIPTDVNKEVFINEYAFNEYNRCFVELSEMGVIQTTDISSLIMLCDLWGVYCDMKDAIRGKRYLVQTPKGFDMTNPDLTNFFRSYAEYFKLCKEFGLTPVARTKINTSPKDTGDEFDNL